MSYLIHYYYLIHHGIFANNYGSISKSIFLGLSRRRKIRECVSRSLTGLYQGSSTRIKVTARAYYAIVLQVVQV